jgi:hypothetical protein
MLTYMFSLFGMVILVALSIYLPWWAFQVSIARYAML